MIVSLIVAGILCLCAIGYYLGARRGIFLNPFGVIVVPPARAEEEATAHLTDDG